MAEQKITDPFLDPDSKTLEDWAGTKTLSQGRQYQTEGRVHEMVRSRNGAIIAWVNETERYATAVYFKEGIQSVCTCPVGSCCKHAVAVILEYLAKPEDNRQIPDLPDDDPRPQLLANRAKSIPDLNQSVSILDFLRGYGSIAKEKPDEPKKSHLTIRDYLSGLAKEDLIDLLESFMNKFPSIRSELNERKSDYESDIGPIQLALLTDIDNISSEEAYSNLLNDGYHIPDYSQVRERMELLMTRGYPDAVVDAGSILIRKGSVQIQQSDPDDCDTVWEISSCMDLVFKALQCSNRPDHERIIFAIRVKLDDEFDICDDHTSNFLKKDYPGSEWGLVADRLFLQLGDLKYNTETGEPDSSYYRDCLVGWIVTALDHAGREQEATDLCVVEVDRTHNYARLIHRLLQNGRRDEAGTWITRGIEATLKPLPGIAAELRTIQQELWEKEGETLLIAGVWAEEFMSEPSYSTYCNLKLSSENCGVWDTVKISVMQYLKDGVLPVPGTDGKTKTHLVFGALPRVGLTDPKFFRTPGSPFIDTLIDIAIAEKQPDEILAWYDWYLRPGGGRSMYYHPEDKIADAVADQYPDRALSLWKEKLEPFKELTDPEFDKISIVYIKKIRALMKKKGMDAAWKKYLAKLRREYAEKKSLLKMLMDLEGKKIKKS
ncbi:MAG: SWIM zinc finger family protein [Methanoregula sp.]|nr:SWIM zinc finger family protein [Methanoregula sp.]